MLLATPYFWSNEGKGSYANYDKDLYLEITLHAKERANERNVRLDSILAIAQMCGDSKLIRDLNEGMFYVRYIGETSLDSIVIPFSKKALASSRDLVLYATSVMRYLDEDDNIFFKHGRRIFDLTITKNGEALICEIDG